jgi:hypothetical protein
VRVRDDSEVVAMVIDCWEDEIRKETNDYEDPDCAEKILVGNKDCFH